MERHVYNLGIRVLIYKEDGEFCAHALELDLLGYGKTEKEAISALCEVVQAQMSFARFKNDDSLLPFGAPKEFFDKWEVAHLAALKNEFAEEEAAALQIKAVWVAMDDEFASIPKGRFKIDQMPCA